jgi:hypothetical protein
MRTETWTELVAAENVPCRALVLSVVTPSGLRERKHVNAKNDCFINFTAQKLTGRSIGRSVRIQSDGRRSCHELRGTRPL